MCMQGRGGDLCAYVYMYNKISLHKYPSVSISIVCPLFMKNNIMGFGSLSSTRPWLPSSYNFQSDNYSKLTEIKSVSAKEQCPQNAYCLHILLNPCRENFRTAATASIYNRSSLDIHN